MTGKQIGLNAAARINKILNEMRNQCADDPKALIEAASVLSRLFSLTNEDAPLTQVLRQMRRDAIGAMSEAGLSDAQIADRIGMSRSRVQQIRTTASEGARKAAERGRRPALAPTPVPAQADTLPVFEVA